MTVVMTCDCSQYMHSYDIACMLVCIYDAIVLSSTSGIGVHCSKRFDIGKNSFLKVVVFFLGYYSMFL